MKWSNLLFGKSAATIVSVALAALLGLWSVRVLKHPPVAEILVASVYLVIQAAKDWYVERSVLLRYGHNFDGVVRRILHLVSDLADLSGGNFSLWKVDLYLPKASWHVTWTRPWLVRRRLVREMSISLVDAPSEVGAIELDDVFFGSCYADAESALWWNPIFGRGSQDVQNHYLEGRLAQGFNDELASTFGLVNVHPIVNKHGNDCLGLVLVYVVADPIIVTKALGVLGSPEARRRLHGACRDLHDQMSKT